jgi:quercetin dioxygenase-like cupin family protein
LQKGDPAVKRNIVLLVVGCVVLIGIQLGRAQAPGAAEKTVVLRPAAELKWMDAPGVKGVQQAVAWGDPAKGAHGSFVKFAPGAEAPLHIHTASGRSVVVSGTVVISPEGQKPRELGPGSFFSVPGGTKHTTACKAGAECIIYSEWLGPFDIKPVEGEMKRE